MTKITRISERAAYTASRMRSPDHSLPFFDPAAIDRLRKVAGDQGSGFVAEMAQLFLEETTRCLDLLRVGGDRGDWTTVSRIAHSLKSSSATLGLMRVSRACMALELDTKSAASGPETESLVADVFAEFEQAAPILKSLS